MGNQQERILAGGLIGAAILTAAYVLLDKTPLIRVAYVFLLLDLALVAGSLWQLSKTNKEGYLAALSFPLGLTLPLFLSVSMVLMAVALSFLGWEMPWRWLCVIQLIFLGVTGWRMLVIGAGEEVIQNVDEQVKVQTSTWELLRTDAEVFQCSVPATAQQDFVRVRDAIRYADPVSIPEVSPIEQKIQTLLQQMKTLADKGEDTTAIACQIENLVQDRAMRMKLLK